MAQITVELPDEIASDLQREWGDLPRRTLEALAVDAYRSGQLSSYQVRLLLGYETPMELHALLKRSGVARDYTEADLALEFGEHT